MRGAFMIGIVIVLLIIGILVMKNMGTGTSGGVSKTQAKGYIERAKDTSDQVQEKAKKINNQLHRSNEQ